MARQIKLSQIGDYASEQYEKLLRAAVFRTDSLVKERSPVDSGRLRLSWAIGENAAPFQGVPEGDYRGQPVPPPRAVNYTFGQEKLGNVYSVHNNLPYAEPVLTGKNLPPSWNGRWRSIENQIQQNYIPYMVAKDIKDFVKKTADKIARES